MLCGFIQKQQKRERVGKQGRTRSRAKMFTIGTFRVLVAALALSGTACGLHVAVVQFTPLQDAKLSPGANMEAHAVSMLAYLNEAASSSARLAVFPELSLGFDCTNRSTAQAYAFRLPGMDSGNIS